MNPLKSKTFWFAVIVAAGKLIQDHSPSGITEAVGIIGAAWGVRDAIAKNGNGQ